MNKWIGLAILIAVVAIALVAFIAASSSAGNQETNSTAGDGGYQTPQQIGAYFAETYGRVEPAQFDSTVTREAAQENAVDYFIGGLYAAKDQGIEELLEVKSTTGLFSGAKDGFGPWTINDREVWVVVIDDLPFSLPCGPERPAGVPCPYHPPRFNVAVDARTGEIISSELTGAGNSSSKWDSF